MTEEEKIIVKNYCKYLVKKYGRNFLGAIKEIMQDFFIRSQK